MSSPASVPYGNTFLLVGGNDEVFRFIPETEEWEEMPEKLSQGRFGVTAMLIHPDDIDSHEGDIAEYLV